MMFQTQSTSLRALTTAHLAQTMTLLELTSAELGQKIESALAENPALELAPDPRCPQCGRRIRRGAICPVCSAPRGMSDSQPVVFVSARGDGYASDMRRSRPSKARDDAELAREEWAAASEDLPHFVLHQIAAELAPADRPLAAHLLTSLDEDGLLTVTPQEVARYHHLPLSRVEAVLNLIQHAEPLGVGCSTPSQALLVQIAALEERHQQFAPGEAATPAPPPAARMAVERGLDLLSRRAYPELAQRLGISTAQAQAVARYIHANLNPYPARAHWGASPSNTGLSADIRYGVPDVIITRQNTTENTPLVVEIFSPYAGALRINPLFRQAFDEAAPEKAEQWRADLEQASLLVKCLQQRDHTLTRLMERLVVLQRGYLLHGDAALEPLTRAQLALELGVHESTVSRAVAGKSVQLPNRRIVPLARFFDRSLNVRTALRQIVAEETCPLSDEQIASLLEGQGFPVARRTVAKYRAMEGILPARLRQPTAKPSTNVPPAIPLVPVLTARERAEVWA